MLSLQAQGVALSHHPPWHQPLSPQWHLLMGKSVFGVV